MTNFSSTTWLVEPSRGPRPFQPGDIVMDNWEIVRLLGEGGYGSVYEIRKNIYGVDSVSALKVIPIPKERGYVSALRSMGSTKAQIEEEIRNQVNRSVAEVQTMKRLIDHPAVVRCEDFSVVQYEEDDSWEIFIRMEMLMPLADWLDNNPISEDKVREIGITLADLLQYCANEKILHRDIKPANIFMNRLGSAKLGDFGLARTLSAGTSTHSHGVGTDAFMAPEVAANQHYDTHADMYSLGLVLYWLLNKRRLPFMDQGVSFERSIVMRVSGKALPPIEGVDKGLMDAVLKACAFKPEDRFEDAAAMKQALSGAITKKENAPVDSEDKGIKSEEHEKETKEAKPVTDPLADYDPWTDKTFDVGNTVEGVIVDITDEGFTLQLAPGMETFCWLTGYTDERIANLTKYLYVGRVMDVEVIEIDPENKLINVNEYNALKDFLEELEEDEAEEKTEPVAPPTTPPVSVSKPIATSKSEPAPKPVQEDKPAPIPAPKPVQENKPAAVHASKPVQENKPTSVPASNPVQENKPTSILTPKPTPSSKPAQAPAPKPTPKSETKPIATPKSTPQPTPARTSPAITETSKSAPKNKKRLFWILFALAAVAIAAVGLVVTSGNKDENGSTSQSTSNTSKVSSSTTTTNTTVPISLSAGDIITFGHYEQDNDKSNGQEPIEWQVLDFDEANNKVLLISRYGLDAISYHSNDTNITWEECSLRDWLNNDFWDTAFTFKEQNSILVTDVDNSVEQGYSAWGSYYGENTQDQVFLLSYAEASRYFGTNLDDKTNNMNSRISPTAYAIAQGAYTSSNELTKEGDPTGYWWLRSPGIFTSHVLMVNFDGSIYESFSLWRTNACVRPAIWLNLDALMSENGI